MAQNYSNENAAQSALVEALKTLIQREPEQLGAALADALDQAGLARLGRGAVMSIGVANADGPAFAGTSSDLAVFASLVIPGRGTFVSKTGEQAQRDTRWDEITRLAESDDPYADIQGEPHGFDYSNARPTIPPPADLLQGADVKSWTRGGPTGGHELG